jgi:hypothetical protein
VYYIHAHAVGALGEFPLPQNGIREPSIFIIPENIVFDLSQICGSAVASSLDNTAQPRRAHRLAW